MLDAVTGDAYRFTPRLLRASVARSWEPQRGEALQLPSSRCEAYTLLLLLLAITTPLRYVIHT